MKFSKEMEAAFEHDVQQARIQAELSVVPNAVLDTVVAFLDTCPEVEDAEIAFGERGDVATYDDPDGSQYLELEVGGTKYVVTVCRVKP